MPEEFAVPPAAEPGDRVAVVAPSSGLAGTYRHVFERAVDRLRSHFDVEPIVDPTARQSNAFLAEHPEARAAAIHAAFRDPDVRAVFATIGGEDQIRVLPHLDGDVLCEHPTRFFGMSDNTCLASYLWEQGVVSFYGGQLLNNVATPDPLPEYTERYVRRALFDASLGTLEPVTRWTDDVVPWDDPDFPTREPEYEESGGWRWHGDRRVEQNVSRLPAERFATLADLLCAHCACEIAPRASLPRSSSGVNARPSSKIVAARLWTTVAYTSLDGSGFTPPEAERPPSHSRTNPDCSTTFVKLSRGTGLSPASSIISAASAGISTSVPSPTSRTSTSIPEHSSRTTSMAADAARAHRSLSVSSRSRGESPCGILSIQPHRTVTVRATPGGPKRTPAFPPGR